MTAQDIIKSDAHFRVAGWSDGIAWYCASAELVDEYDEETGENVTEWTGYQVPTGLVLMVMVGDDRKFPTDPDDVEEIPEDSFCRDCGQIGCGHNVYS
jgi:hypothetical protein